MSTLPRNSDDDMLGGLAKSGVKDYLILGMGMASFNAWLNTKSSPLWSAIWGVLAVAAVAGIMARQKHSIKRRAELLGYSVPRLKNRLDQEKKAFRLTMVVSIVSAGVGQGLGHFSRPLAPPPSTPQISPAAPQAQPESPAPVAPRLVPFPLLVRGGISR